MHVSHKSWRSWKERLRTSYSICCLLTEGRKEEQVWSAIVLNHSHTLGNKRHCWYWIRTCASSCQFCAESLGNHLVITCTGTLSCLAVSQKQMHLPGQSAVKGKKEGCKVELKSGSCFPTELWASPTLLRTILAFLGFLPPSSFIACYKNQDKFIPMYTSPKIICLRKKGINSNHKDSNLSYKFVIPTREPLWFCRTCQCCIPNSRHLLYHTCGLLY